MCYYKTNRIKVLDSSQYMSGYEFKAIIPAATTFHNNWLEHHKDKTNRERELGLNEWDDRREVCTRIIV